MIQFLKNLLAGRPKTDYGQLMKNGAQIIDVRMPAEFRGGHIRGAVNIPLQELHSNLSRIKRDRPVITCCASGMRSASAKNLLRSNGFPEVYNGGGWTSLQSRISR